MTFVYSDNQALSKQTPGSSNCFILIGHIDLWLLIIVDEWQELWLEATE
jgi:hypothetical protein